MSATPQGAATPLSVVVSAPPPPVLSAKEDLYGGLIVDADQLPHDAHAFGSLLNESLEHWRSQGKRGIWLKVPLARAALVPVAADQGFEFHHAERDYVMMTHWLPQSPNTLPANASHQVGVGAFVVNSRREVLVVQERSGPLRGRGVWKMPTGLVSVGEDFTLAAERELLEETGVTARFEAVLSLRQAHGFAFGKSDMFLVCAMRPEPDQQQVRVQESELVDARWLPLEQYTGQDFFKDMPLYDKLLERCVAWANGRYHGLRAEKLQSSVSRPRMDLLLWGDDVC